MFSSDYLAKHTISFKMSDILKHNEFQEIPNSKTFSVLQRFHNKLTVETAKLSEIISYKVMKTLTLLIKSQKLLRSLKIFH